MISSSSIIRYHNLYRTAFVTLGICCSKLEGATTWIGGNGDIGNSASWSNGMPNSGNIGTIQAGNALTYSQSSALNNTVIIVEGTIPNMSSISGAQLSMSDAALTLTQDTALNVSQDLTVGWSGSSDSSLTLQNEADLAVTTALVIGRKKRGVVNQGGNSSASADSLLMGAQSGGANSIYTITGGTLDITNSAEIKRQSEFIINGGTINIGDDFIARNSNSSITITQGQLNVGDRLNINSGSKLNIQGGTTDVTGHFTVKNTNSLATISNGTILVGKNYRVQRGANINQTGGAITTSGNTIVTNNGSIYNFSSGTLTTKNLTIKKSGVFNHTGGTLTIQNNGFVNTSGIYNQAGSVQIGNSLTIDNGTWNAQSSILDITNNLSLTTTGATFSQTGTNVTIGNDLVINSGAQYTLENTALLQVENKFIVQVDNNFTWQNGGTIAVHPNATIINYEGDMIASSGAILNLGSESEKLVVSGAFSYDNLTVNGYDMDFLGKRANPATLTGCVTLIEAGSISGSGLNINFNTTGASLINAGDPYTPLVDNVYWIDTTSNQVNLCWSLAPIPEPSTSMLLLIGSSCLLCRRHRLN